jgi:hypothetical protein
MCRSGVTEAIAFLAEVERWSRKFGLAIAPGQIKTRKLDKVELKI